MAAISEVQYRLFRKMGASPEQIFLFYPVSFHKAAKLGLTDLRELYTRHSSVEPESLQSFMAVKLQATHVSWRSVEALFLNKMRLFDDDCREKGKHGRKELPLDKWA